MPVGRISKTFSSFPSALVAVKDQFGAPARLYYDAAGANAMPDLGMVTATATGAVDFYVSDEKSYTLEVYYGGQLVDRIGGVEATGTTPQDGAGVSTVGASRNLTAADHGMTLECTAAVTLTFPAGLPRNFACKVLPNATTTFASAGGTLINGGTGNVTRAAATAANAVILIVARSAANSFVISGA